jgi:hypothetical protein
MRVPAFYNRAQKLCPHIFISMTQPSSMLNDIALTNKDRLCLSDTTALLNLLEEKLPEANYQVSEYSSDLYEEDNGPLIDNCKVIYDQLPLSMSPR